MMTDLHFRVPVVAHRLYGTRYIERISDIGSRLPGMGSIGATRAGLIRGGSVLYPAINRDHGTRITVESIRGIFVEDRESAGTSRFSVNTYWEPMGIQLELVGIIDEVVDSHFADFIPSDTRYYKTLVDTVANRTVTSVGSPVVDHMARNEIHLIFARSLEGRAGQAYGSSKFKSSWILLGDFLPRPHETEEETWNRWIGTVAHEFGHVLHLTHRDDRQNLMWPYQTDYRLEIKATQMRIAQAAADSYSVPPRAPFIAPYLGIRDEFRLRI